MAGCESCLRRGQMSWKNVWRIDERTNRSIDHEGRLSRSTHIRCVTQRSRRCWLASTSTWSVRRRRRGPAETLLQEHQPDLLVMEIDLAEGREAALRDDLERPSTRCPAADGDRPVGDRRSLRHRRRVRQRRGCVRAEDVRPGRDRHGDPAGLRAVRLPGTAAGASGPGDGQPAACAS